MPDAKPPEAPSKEFCDHSEQLLMLNCLVKMLGMIDIKLDRLNDAMKPAKKKKKKKCGFGV